MLCLTVICCTRWEGLYNFELNFIGGSASYWKSSSVKKWKNKSVEGCGASCKNGERSKPETKLTRLYNLHFLVDSNELRGRQEIEVFWHCAGVVLWLYSAYVLGSWVRSCITHCYLRGYISEVVLRTT